MTRERQNLRERASGSDLADAIDAIPLIDHHCHSFFTHPLQPSEVEDALTESPDASAARTSTFDSNLGLTTLRWAGPILGLEPPVAPAQYLSARSALGPGELITAFLTPANVSDLLIDTGFRAAELLSVQELSAVVPGQIHEILRLETTAEQLLDELDSAEAFLDAWPALLANLGPEVVGLKSIAAYRSGLALSGETASRSEVAFALGHELSHHPRRIHDPAVVGYLVRSAIDITRLPLQFHIGIGDPDVRLATARPGHLQEIIEFANAHHSAICLLHCYPYHREASLLAHDYPNVYLDLGLALNFVGHSAPHILAETLELAPFAKLLYSSDAYGLPELNYLGAFQFRRSLTAYLQELINLDYLTTSRALDLANLMARDSARELYNLQSR